MRGAAAADGSLRGGAALVVVMAAVQDPGNIGTIVRSAEAFGATGVVTTGRRADPWSPKAPRASGRIGITRSTFARDGGACAANAVARMGLGIVAAGSHSDCCDASASGGTNGDRQRGITFAMAIFIGNEGAGLAREIESAADGRISIPMTAGVESLNAGVAASVVLYEAARQRKGLP